MSTWGPTNLAANADDGNDASGWNVSGFGGVNYFDTDTYPAWSFPMPAIAAGATISKVYLRAYAVATASGGAPTVTLRVEDVDPASQTAWGAAHLPSAATPINTDLAAASVTTTDGYKFGESDSCPRNLASALQDLVDTYGAISLNERINIWGLITNSGANYLGVKDYSDEEPQLPTLYIEWTEGGGPSSILRQMIAHSE